MKTSIVGIFSALLLATGQSESLVCPEGFEIHRGSCYFFSHGEETWIGAFESCKLFDAMLVEVNSALENDYLSNKLVGLQRSNPNARWWIGLTDKQVENEWVWESSKVTLTSDMFSSWGVNEPDGNTNENCVFYGGKDWGDAGCSRTEFYICEVDAEASEIIG